MGYECVNSSSFSMIVNGSPSLVFYASQGIRKGDPLSPYLFILMVEGLERLLKHHKDGGSIHG